MKFSAFSLLLGLSIVLSFSATSASAQSVVPQEYQLPGPLAKWQTDVESQISKALVAPSPDRKSIILEVRRLEVSLSSDAPIKSFFKPGSFEVHSGSMPSVDWNADIGNSRVSVDENAENSTAEFAAACDSVRTSTPVMLAKLDDKAVRAMMRSIGGIVEAPTSTCYSGMPVTISDTVQRPFVVGVKPLKKGDFIAHQPIIQTIEDGLIMRFKPTANDGKVELDASFAYSRVSNVETFQISGTEGEGVTIQVPEQTLKQVRLSASLEDGETLFVDPRLKIETERRQEKKTPFGKAKVVTVEKQIYFLVTPRIIVQSEEVATSLTQVK